MSAKSGKFLRLITVIVAALVALAVVADPGLAANPGWITSCQYSHSLNDDPIVFLGMPGASHLHDFIGGKSTNAFSTPESLRAGGTTCLMEGDSSGYWVPALYQNGKLVLPTATSKHALFYYRRVGGAADGSAEFSTIPDGLKIIVGNAHAASPAENAGIRSGRIFFKCGPGGGTQLPAPPTQCDSGVMVLGFTFPNCWDGRRLESSDQSHMAYPSRGKCPKSHPIAVPRLQAYIRYPVGTAPIGEITLASGEYWSAHMDFFNAWDPAVLQTLIDRCINGLLDCGKNPDV